MTDIRSSLTTIGQHKLHASPLVAPPSSSLDKSSTDVKRNEVDVRARMASFPATAARTWATVHHEHGFSLLDWRARDMLEISVRRTRKRDWSR